MIVCFNILLYISYIKRILLLLLLDEPYAAVVKTTYNHLDLIVTITRWVKSDNMILTKNNSQ